MSSRLGLDAWAVGIHVFVTVTVTVVAAGLVHSPNDEIAIPAVLGLSAVIFEWRRRRALQAAAPEGLTTGEVAAQRLLEVEERVAELDLLHARLTELEERVDFSERMLVERSQPPVGEGRGLSGGQP